MATKKQMLIKKIYFSAIDVANTANRNEGTLIRPMLAIYLASEALPELTPIPIYEHQSSCTFILF